MAKTKIKHKIILKNHQSPGDLVMMAYAIKALHEQHPDKFITGVDTSCNEIFEGNPYITKLDSKDPSVQVLQMDYPTIHESNQKPVHFVNAFAKDLETKLAKYSIKLEPTEWQGAIFISEEEKGWHSQVHEILGFDPPFWVLGAGHKWDFVAKTWDFTRWQKIIDRFPDIWFVQIGAKEHNHPMLTGKKLINLIGKTDMRQLVRLIWHSFGVITPISLSMHLSYALEPHPRYNRKSRGAIILSGGREPNHWQAAANQQFIHTCGMLPCSDLGGCWVSRLIPGQVGDGDEKDKENLCLYPIQLSSGQWIAKCIDMISADEVCLLIKKYMDNLDYKCEKEPDND
jgi:hypothetical protein